MNKKFNIHISQEVALTLKDFTGIVFRYEKHLWYSSGIQANIHCRENQTFVPNH